MNAPDGPEEPRGDRGSHEILGHVAGPRPVMCAIDADEASQDALLAAAWLARAMDTRLVLAHAFDPLGIPARVCPQ